MQAPLKPLVSNTADDSPPWNPSPRTQQIQDLEHLEAVLERAGSQLLVLCLYSRSCGACKMALQRLEGLCAEVGGGVGGPARRGVL
jgi:hypothetical protein